MRILAVETATNQQSVAVLDGSRVLGARSHGVQTSHTRWLVPTIDQLLVDLHLDLTQLSGLAVSIGPGSFTGLRAGLATMSGFRLALELPLVLVPTLEAMAWNYRPHDEIICPMLKARAGEVYWACFRWKGEVLTRITEDAAGPLDRLLESIDSPTWVFGEGWLANSQEWSTQSSMFKPAPSEVHHTSAINVGFASMAHFEKGNIAESGIRPNYLLPSYAELTKSRKKVCS